MWGPVLVKWKGDYKMILGGESFEKMQYNPLLQLTTKE